MVIVIIFFQITIEIMSWTTQVTPKYIYRKIKSLKNLSESSGLRTGNLLHNRCFPDNAASSQKLKKFVVWGKLFDNLDGFKSSSPDIGRKSGQSLKKSCYSKFMKNWEINGNKFLSNFQEDNKIPSKISSIQP